MKRLRDLQAEIEAGFPVRIVDTAYEYTRGAVKYQGAYYAVDNAGLSEFPTFDTLCRYIGADGLLSEWEQARALTPDMAREIQRIQAIVPGSFAPAGTPDDLVVLISAIRMLWSLDEDQDQAAS